VNPQCLHVRCLLSEVLLTAMMAGTTTTMAGGTTRGPAMTWREGIQPERKSLENAQTSLGPEATCRLETRAGVRG
jgi:hypothetical protein